MSAFCSCTHELQTGSHRLTKLLHAAFGLGYLGPIEVALAIAARRRRPRPPPGGCGGHRRLRGGSLETTTTAPPTTTTTASVESRLTKVEQRVTVIEQTTSTTVPKPATPTIEFYFEEPATRFGRDASQWVIVFRPAGPSMQVGNIVAFVDRTLLDPAIGGEGSMSRPAPTYLKAATVEWDGGSQPVLRCC